MRLAQLSQWVRGGFALLVLIAYGMQYHLMLRLRQGEKLSAGAAAASDWWVEVLTGLQLVVIIAAIVALLLWFYRAYKNVHRLPGANPEYNTSMAVWSWFIPFINLWYPYKIMAELGHYLGGFSNARNAISTPRWDYALVAWWTLHIGIVIISRVTTSSIFAPTDNSSVEDLLLHSRLLMTAQVFTVLSAAATLTLLKTLAPHERFLLATNPAPTAAPAT